MSVSSEQMVKQQDTAVGVAQSSSAASSSRGTSSQAETSSSQEASRAISIVDGLDIAKIESKLKEAGPYFVAAEGQELALIIGRTGAGKSTLINYLMGMPMEYVRVPLPSGGFRRIVRVRGDAEGVATIGHTAESETLYAKTLPPQENTTFAWTDCPGFEGNKSKSDVVIESISTELTIRKARNIKGLILVIPIEDLIEARASNLSRLVKTLLALFKNHETMLWRSTVVVTKSKLVASRDATEEDIEDVAGEVLGTLHSLLEFFHKQQNQLGQEGKTSDGLTGADYSVLEDCVQQLIELHKDFVYLNPLDKGASRELIIQRVEARRQPRAYYTERIANSIKKQAEQGWRKLKGVMGFDNSAASMPAAIDDQDLNRPITIDDFNFSEFEANRVLFNKVVYDWAREGRKSLENVEKQQAQYQATLTTFAENETQIENDHAELANLRQSGDLAAREAQTRASIETWERNRTINQTSITNKEGERDNNLTTINDLQQELSQLDVNTELFYRGNSHSNYVPWYAPLGWRQFDFDIDTNGIKIVRLDVDDNGTGSWYDVDDRRETGIFTATYKSKFWARPAKAHVHAYICTKDEPGNRLRIQEIRDELLRLGGENTRLNAEIATLQARNEELQGRITRSRDSLSQEQVTIDANIRQLEVRIHEYEGINKTLESQLAAHREEGMRLLSIFQSMRERLNLVESLSAQLFFPSNLVRKFVAKYQAFSNALIDGRYRDFILSDDVIDAAAPASSSSPSLVSAMQDVGTFATARQQASRPEQELSSETPETHMGGLHAGASSSS